MMSSGDFDWRHGPVAVPGQSAIAIHLTETFDVAVRQRGRSGASDSVIEVARGNCLQLCAAILRAAGEHRFQIVESTTIEKLEA